VLRVGLAATPPPCHILAILYQRTWFYKAYNLKYLAYLHMRSN